MIPGETLEQRWRLLNSKTFESFSYALGSDTFGGEPVSKSARMFERKLPGIQSFFRCNGPWHVADIREVKLSTLGLHAEICVSRDSSMDFHKIDICVPEDTDSSTGLRCIGNCNLELLNALPFSIGPARKMRGPGLFPQSVSVFQGSNSPRSPPMSRIDVTPFARSTGRALALK